MKKLLHNLIITGVLVSSAFLFSGCFTGEYVSSYNYSTMNPTWAPPYYAGARYYYFPDIESYYDISRSDFVILRNGQWIFVKSINPYYPDFNLDVSYIVVLNSNVYQPWMHYQYYTSHYPRYYYRDYYDRSNIPYVRGFNENNKSAFYWDEKNRDKARDWNGSNFNNNRRFSYSENDKKMQDETTRRVNQSNEQSRNTNYQNNTNTNNNTRNTGTNYDRNNNSNDRSNQNNNSGNKDTNIQNNTNNNSRNNETTINNRNNDNNSAVNNRNNSTRDNNSNVSKQENTNYYGRPIGQPVKVERQMRDTNTSKNASSNSKSSSRSQQSTDNSTKSSSQSGRR